MSKFNKNPYGGANMASILKTITSSSTYSTYNSSSNNNISNSSNKSKNKTKNTITVDDDDGDDDNSNNNDKNNNNNNNNDGSTTPTSNYNNNNSGTDSDNNKDSFSGSVSESDEEEPASIPLPGEDAAYKFKHMDEILPAFPSFWNGEQWVKVDRKKIEISKKFQKGEVTVMSWNIWFGTRNYRTRLIELGKEVQKHDPDIICFQEMTVDFMKILTAQPWSRQYYISDQQGHLLERYGNVVFSKVQFHECVVKNLESRMGRKAIISTFLVRGGPQLTLGTFHLESYLEDGPFRAKQLQVFNEITSGCSHVVLVGDTNFVSDTETSPLTDRFGDAWPELYHKTPEEALKNPGLTFDTETNPMLKEEYDSRKMGTKRQRLDRCFFSRESVQVMKMQILGNTPYNGSEFISDHYGILVKLKFRDDYVNNNNNNNNNNTNNNNTLKAEDESSSDVSLDIGTDDSQDF